MRLRAHLLPAALLQAALLPRAVPSPPPLLQQFVRLCGPELRGSDLRRPDVRCPDLCRSGTHLRRRAELRLRKGVRLRSRLLPSALLQAEVLQAALLPRPLPS